MVHIFIHILDIISSTGRNICTIEGADWHREEYYVQKKTDGGQKVAFHKYVSGTRHREMHFLTCRVTYFLQRRKYVITLSGGQALRSGSDYCPESQEAGIRSRL